LQDAQFNYWAQQRENRHSHAGRENGNIENDLTFDPQSNLLSEPFGYRTESSERIALHQNGDANGSSARNRNGQNDNQRSGPSKEIPQEPQYWLLRSKGSTLRGVLSEKYTPLDNGTLFDTLAALLQEQSLASRFQVRWFDLDEEALHLRLVDPSLTRDIFADDRLLAGIHIANSEVGKRSVTVDALVFRLVCSNGLIRLIKGKSLLQQRHIHLSQPRFQAALQQAMGQALATSAGFIEQLVWATTEPVPDVEAALKALSHTHHFSQSFQELVKLALLQEKPAQQETKFGLVNALTNAAQRLDANQRYEVEVLAGKLLESRFLNGAPHAASSPPNDTAQSVSQFAQEMFNGEVVTS
jgi:hypothetical protein